MGRFSDTFMDHFTAPRNAGTLDAPDLTGHAGAPGRGPFLILHLGIDRGRVARARYRTYGCGATIAAGSILTELIAGRTIPECLALTPERLVEALDGVPPDKLHGPHLAIAALRDALKAYGPG